MATRIAVVDYGMGNLRSVAKALTHVAPKSRVDITCSHADIARADRVVFPGQGAARDCMRNLHEHELGASVVQAFGNKPFLGICMGLQVLFNRSDENGGVACLGLIEGGVHGFERPALASAPKVPHMGWNEVRQTSAHPLWKNIKDNARFYFVHSYFVQTKDAVWQTGTTSYLGEFTSAIARDNVFATQFHPEKSASDGLCLLKNFINWKPG